MKTLSQLNEPLSGMRRDTADYALMPDNDACSWWRCVEVRCTVGAIECKRRWLRCRQSFCG